MVLITNTARAFFVSCYICKVGVFSLGFYFTKLFLVDLTELEGGFYGVLVLYTPLLFNTYNTSKIMEIFCFEFAFT